MAQEKFADKYISGPHRAQFWDYSAPGSYFITICVEGRQCILGRVVDGEMVLSDFGHIVAGEFQHMQTYHPRATVDAWVVMPNHVHFIITLGPYGESTMESSLEPPLESSLAEKIHEFSLHERDWDGGGGDDRDDYWIDDGPNDNSNLESIKSYRKRRRNMVIPKMVGKFKTLTSKYINVLRNTPGHKNWQHDYDDRIIRNEKMYHHVKRYIINNPRSWDRDWCNRI